MKETFKSLLVYILIIYFVSSIVEGFILPNITIYLIGSLLLLSLTIMIACPLLNFLTIKCKFPSFFLMSSLLLTGVLYLMKMFMTDFYIEAFEFQGLNLGSIEINSFTVTPLIAIILFSVLSSFLAAIYRELDES